MAINQIINANDEIIIGAEKYFITDNEDGTKNISLANEVIESGTPIIEDNFNKISNVLSYLQPDLIDNENNTNNFYLNNNSSFSNEQRIFTVMKNDFLLKDKSSIIELQANSTLDNPYAMILLSDNTIAFLYNNGGSYYCRIDLQGNILNKKSISDSSGMNGYAVSSRTQICELSDGNIVITSPAESSNIWAFKISKTGEIITSRKNLSVQGGYVAGETVELNDGTLVLYYGRSNDDLSLCYYNKDTLSRITTVNVNTALFANKCSLIPLQNGNLMMLTGYNNNTGIKYTFGFVYSNTGTLLYSKTSTTGDDLLLDAYHCTYEKLPNGNIKVYYANGYKIISKDLITIQDKTSIDSFDMGTGNDNYFLKNNGEIYVYRATNKISLRNLDDVSMISPIKNNFYSISDVINGFFVYPNKVVIIGQEQVSRKYNMLMETFTITNDFLNMKDITNNTLNGIQVDTLMQPTKRYELIYNNNNVPKFIAHEITI